MCWFGAEARLEAAPALTTLQWIGCGSGRQDAEPDELRTELVADVYRLRGCVFEVQPHLRDGAIRPAAHAGGGELVVGPLGGGRRSLSLRRADDGGAGIRRPLSSFNVSRLIAADLQLTSAFQDTDLVEYLTGSPFIDAIAVGGWSLDAEGMLPTKHFVFVSSAETAATALEAAVGDQGGELARDVAELASAARLGNVTMRVVDAGALAGANVLRPLK
jgi:hypothetical protein